MGLAGKCRDYPNKTAYTTRKLAERVAGRRAHAEEREIRVYFCSGHYHLTSAPQVGQP